jgi:transposase
MNLHLAEIATVAAGAHAVLLVDQAGWHLSARLVIPANVTILPLPPKSPELNPVENIWQFMRDNWLSNRVFSPSRWPALHWRVQKGDRDCNIEPPESPYAIMRRNHPYRGENSGPGKDFRGA